LATLKTENLMYPVDQIFNSTYTGVLLVCWKQFIFDLIYISMRSQITLSQED